jgi:Malectin domain
MSLRLTLWLLVPWMAGAQSSVGQVVGLNLVLVGSSAIVANLVEGMVVNLAAATIPNFNIDAITAGGPIASVQFSYNNVTNFRIETAAPYAMCGNVGPIFSQCTPPSTVLSVGTHTVSAKTNNGTWFRRTFTIVAAVPPPVAPMFPPVPARVASPVPTAPTAFRPILINCGSNTTYLDTMGRVWSADVFFAGGQTFTRPSTWQILNTLGVATLYLSERWGAFNYTIPVPPGSYNVVLHLAEIL